MKKKLKIGFDAKRLFHNHTGLGNYSRTLVRHLQAQYPEHEYHLFSPKIIAGPETHYFLNTDRFIVHSYHGWFASYWRSKGITKQIKALDLDIYHGLSHEIPILDPSSTTKTIVSFHDLIYELYSQQFGLWDRYMYQKKYRYSAQYADRIVAISESTRKDIISLYDIDPAKISVVYQSCNPAFINTPLTEQTTPKPYFIYVGSLIERKSFLLIVEAMADTPADQRLPVKVVGSSGPYADQIKQKIKELQLDEWFTFYGTIGNSELVSMYDQAIASIYPSIYEGFGIPLIESLYRKTPVITTTASSLPEAGGPGAIYIEPNNKSQLIQAMLDIQNDLALHNKLSNDGYEYVSQRFDAVRLAEEMMGVYEGVVE